MRIIKEVKINVSPTKGVVNRATNQLTLYAAGDFDVEVTTTGEEELGPIVITANRIKGKKKKPGTPEKPPVEPVPEMDWIWSSLGGKSSFQSIDRNAKLFGPKLQINFPKVMEGGGLVWLEPFVPGSEPTNKAPNGYFISAKGEPKILSAVWREYSKNNDGKIINGSLKKINQSVQLHVYTQAMYGHDLQITLMDHDTVDPNDLLIIDQKSQYGAPVAFFTTEVRVHQMLPDEEKSKLRVASTLAQRNASKPKVLADTSKYHVQKTIIDVYLEEGWLMNGGNRLKIYPKVRGIGRAKEEEFTDAFINVQGVAKEESALTFSGNNPVVVDYIPTEIGTYHACKYTGITLLIPEKDEVSQKDIVKDVILYEQNGTYRNMREFEIVVGEVKNTKKISIRLDNLETLESDCSQPQGQKHKGNVMKMVGYPESSIGNSKPGAVVEKSKWSSTWKHGFEGFGLGKAEEHASSTGENALEILNSTDALFEFNARYIYNKQQLNLAGLAIHWIFRYFWIGKNVLIQPYVVVARTCRHQREIKIFTYPDVSWEIALEFKSSRSKKKATYTPLPAPPTPPIKFKLGLEWEISLALHAKWDDGEKLDLAEDLKDNILKKIKTFTAIADMVKSIFNGEQNNSTSEHTQPNAAARERLKEARKTFGTEQDEAAQKRADLLRVKQQVNDNKDKIKASSGDKSSDEYKDARDEQKGLFEGVSDLKRSVVGFDVEWPEIALAFSWCRVNTNAKQRQDLRNQTGILLSGTVEAKPLIGLSAYLDFLALIQRAHPIALAVIAAVDLSMKLIGDGSKIVCELRAKGTIGGKLEGFFNTVTKENSFNKVDQANNGKPLATINGDLEFTLLVQIKIEVRKDYVLVQVQGSVEASLEAKAKFSGRGTVGYDDKGFYTQYYGNFAGLEVVGKAKISGQVSGKKYKDPVPTPPPAAGANPPSAEEAKKPTETSSAGKVNLEKSIKYQAIDKQDEKELGRLYLGI